jgi:L-ribulose-5-phosphate 3-epimerase
VTAREPEERPQALRIRSGEWGRVRKGICYVCLPGGTFEERLRRARAAGYDGVELTFSRPGEGPLELGADRAAVRALRDRIRAHGLEVPSVMCGAALAESPLLSADPAVRARGVENLRAALERAAWLGADTVLVHPGQLRPEFRYDHAFEALVAALRQLTAACEATGVALAVENVWNRFLLSPREMRELIDAVGHPLVGAYFDVGNVLLFGYPEHWVAVLGPRIRKVHVKDFRRAVGTAAGFCPLLEGDADYPAVVAALRATGYDGYLTAEVGGDVEETARRLDRILAMGR